MTSIVPFKYPQDPLVTAIIGHVSPFVGHVWSCVVIRGRASFSNGVFELKICKIHLNFSKIVSESRNPKYFKIHLRFYTPEKERVLGRGI